MIRITQFKGQLYKSQAIYVLKSEKAHFNNNNNKKGCKTGVYFSREKPLSGKNINSESTEVRILILLCVAINLLASVVVGFFVSSPKW